MCVNMPEACGVKMAASATEGEIPYNVSLIYLGCLSII